MKRKIELEYKCVQIQNRSCDTERMLNELASQGWQLVTSYSDGCWLILCRTK